MEKFKWTVEIEVDAKWVGDGFTFDEDQCRDTAIDLIPWAYPGEVRVRMLTAPDPRAIKKVQGHDDAVDPKLNPWR